MTNSSENKMFVDLAHILDGILVNNDYLGSAKAVERIAVAFEKKGYEGEAQSLRLRAKMLHKKASTGKQQSSRQSKKLQEQSEKLGFDLFNPSQSEEKAKDYVPNQENIKIVEELTLMIKKRNEFKEAGISLPNKTLMFGPPGTGKTISAHYIASQLGLPLIVVRLDTLIDSLLGGTANNLRKIFDAANAQDCVLFLDEFDAIATNRKSLNEGGPGQEMKRVVNSLLQNLDGLSDKVMLFAATNLDSEIDPAVWRRFHNRMNFRLPNKTELHVYLMKQLENFELAQSIIEDLNWRSFADIEIVLNKAKTKCILRGFELTREVIIEALNENLLQNTEAFWE